MGFSRILAEFAEKMWLAENPPEKNTASRKSAEKVGQPAEYNKKIRLVGLRLTVPRCRLSTYGYRAFYYTTGPAVWNSLPDELRNSESFDSFKRFLKTILFSRY